MTLCLSPQIAAAWQRLCDQSGNADMSQIARLMPHCKLYIDNKAKVYAQDAVCVWCKETTNLHPAALVPVTDHESTMGLGQWPKEPGLSAIQFHIGSAFKDALRCVHTLLFILDYVPFQIEASKKKIDGLLKGEWCLEMEQELEEGVLKTKTGPLSSVRKSLCDLITANMKAFRIIVGSDIANEFLVPFQGNLGLKIMTDGMEALGQSQGAPVAN